MNRPEIVSVGLVWNSERPTLEHIMEVFSTIGTTLRLGEVFNTVVDHRWAETSVHNLVGVVTYYGKHYSTFFFHTKLRIWIYFDDATVREVGPRWDQVVEKCRKGRYQPLLLLYALPDGTPVNTESAPKTVVPFYPEKPLGKKQALLRRSITPSPEKPMIGNTRRAITPNPDQKPPLPRPLYNEYQNLAVIQSSIYKSVDCVDAVAAPAEPEYTTRLQKPLNIHRTLSNGSSSGTEACFRDYLNIPRTRDSGNWSSDRNSASSSSSTTMEPPYMYPLPRNESASSNSSANYDIGYDSYSLSSNDSSTMTTIQHLMKMGHLAKIPEDYNQSPQVSQSCDVLCDEADELLVKSRQMEDDHDLVLALALCNAAATKARAAMDAPYNNPQTLTLARMKHNTCIMRARSLHRRMTQNQNIGKEVQPEIRHTREGSSGSGKHSRQNSRDKGQHSRQNSKELLCSPTPEKPTKSIEIYATLPKKKDLKKISVPIEDEVVYDKPPQERESRSIFSRKNKDAQKRSRSEDRNKMSRDFSIAPDVINGKDTLKKKEEKDDKKSKKQHKIRRKLLMGGLIKRKNRSMPDLTDASEDKAPAKPNTTLDDSSISFKNKPESNMCGYLSEGHLEYTTNPNLERSKLMRKSFHSSAGKILTAAKVPPPPPLRTTSQLSKTKLNEDTSYSKMIVTRADVHQEGIDEVDCVPNMELPPYPSPLGSAIHSRQASEEFPPPPPPLDLSALEEHLPKEQTLSPNSLLAQLQNKRQEILAHDSPNKIEVTPPKSGDVWLKELQAKQAALRAKKVPTPGDIPPGVDIPPDIPPGNKSSVRDLASKFDQFTKSDSQNGVLTARRRDDTEQIQPQHIETIAKIECNEDLMKKSKLGKKKSVSFCDQVILVATAEEQEDDSYIPNPILERVLRSAMNKPETAAVREEVLQLQLQQAQGIRNDEQYCHQPLYVRRNSMDNLLDQQGSGLPNPDNEYIGNKQSIEPEYGYNFNNNSHPVVRQIPGLPNPETDYLYNYNKTNEQDYNCNYNRQCPGLPPVDPVYNYNYPPQVPQNAQTAYRQSPYQRIPQNSPAYQYANPPRPNYPCSYQMRQSPNPYPVYQHPPSPSPYPRQPVPYNPQPDYYYNEQAYQRVPLPHTENSPYQQVPVKAPLKKTVSFEAGTKGGAESPLPKPVVTPIVVNNANKTKCNLCRKKPVVSANLYCTDCEFYMSRFKPKR